MRYRTRANSYRRLYLTVLAVSLTVLLLPEAWTGRFISLIQLLVPFQHAASVAADAIHSPTADASDDPPVAAILHEALQRERDALTHEVAALATRVRELEGEVEVLTATRLWDIGGRGIGPTGRLIPAQVVTDDLLAWRASRLVNAGTLQGVRAGVPVVSDSFTVDHGRGSGAESGMAILLKETLIGEAAHVGTHTTRVKLLSDISVQMKVRIGRFHGEKFELLEPYFWLAGRGGGIMQIGDVNRRDVAAGHIKIGDTVVSDPLNDRLPVALTIGRIIRIDDDERNPLLSVLTVQSPVAVTQLRRVYIFDPDRTLQDG